MSKKIKRHLHEGEEIHYIEQPSWFKYHKQLKWSFLLLPLIDAALKKYTTHLVITNDRVLLRHGLIGDHSKAVRYNNMTTVKVNQSALGAILNYGHIHIHTQTGGHADLVFHYIKNPIEVKKKIERRIKI